MATALGATTSTTALGTLTVLACSGNSNGDPERARTHTHTHCQLPKLCSLNRTQQHCAMFITLQHPPNSLPPSLPISLTKLRLKVVIVIITTAALPCIAIQLKPAGLGGVLQQQQGVVALVVVCAT